jgi:hypothetical protein
MPALILNQPSQSIKNQDEKEKKFKYSVSTLGNSQTPQYMSLKNKIQKDAFRQTLSYINEKS